MILGCAAVALLLAGAPEDSRGPPTLALMGFRIHVIASEDIDPDGLKSLDRPGVVLWMQTRTNMLRSSVVEGLARFEEAYVQLHPPVHAAHAAQLERARRAGIWLEDADLDGPGVHRLGPRRFAVRISGELTPERAERVRRARPTIVRWAPREEVSVEAWSRLVQLPGAKLADLDAVAERGDGLRICASWTQGLIRDVGLWHDLSRVRGDPPELPRCPGRVQLRVRPDIEDAALARIFAANPATELEVEVGPSESGVRAVRLLIQRLEAASAASTRGERKSP